MRPARGEFDPDDLEAISVAGCVFAAALADIAHHEIGDPGCWDCPDTPEIELARLTDALARMEAAIRQTRAQLRPIEHRARAQAANKEP